MPLAELGKAQKDDRLSLERDGYPIEVSTASPRAQQDVRDVAGSSSSSPTAAPVRASPSFPGH